MCKTLAEELPAAIGSRIVVVLQNVELAVPFVETLDPDNRVSGGDGEVLGGDLLDHRRSRCPFGSEQLAAGIRRLSACLSSYLEMCSGVKCLLDRTEVGQCWSGSTPQACSLAPT